MPGASAGSASSKTLSASVPPVEAPIATTFSVVSAMSRTGDRDLEITDYEGLWRVRPGMAIGMAVCMLALLGFPLFGGAGFWAKVYVLAAAEATPFRHLVPLTVLLVLASVISAGYYLQVVRVMFMKPRPEGAVDPAPLGPMTRAVLAELFTPDEALVWWPAYGGNWSIAWQAPGGLSHVWVDCVPRH